jgi:Ca2+-transporting ATPase
LVLLRLGYDQELVRTFIFAALGTYTLLVAFSVRSLEKSILSYSLFSNHYLTTGIVIGLALMGAAIYLPILQDLFGTVPLTLPWVAGVMLIGLFDIALIEVSKKFFKNKHMNG